MRYYCPFIARLCLVPLLLAALTSSARRDPIDTTDRFVVAVDTHKDLTHSACNSGAWFQYANLTRNLSKAPQVVKDNFKDSRGIWFLQSTPFASIPFENQSPCMEYATSAILLAKMEIVYFLRSSSSSFSVNEYNGKNLLAYVNQTSLKKTDSANLEWDILTIEPKSQGTLHGIILTANITSSDDYLVIDKIVGYPTFSQRM